jgi:hypothetical protein
MQNEQSKRMHVRFVADPSPSSKPSKTMTTLAAQDGSRIFVVNVTEDSSAISAINTLLGFSNGSEKSTSTSSE